MKKIAIVGYGMVASTLSDKLKSEGNDIVVVNSSDEVPELLSKDNKYLITDPYVGLAPMGYYGQSKPFVCKGKHQYENTNGQWICQCGRNIKD